MAILPYFGHMVVRLNSIEGVNYEYILRKQWEYSFLVKKLIQQDLPVRSEIKNKLLAYFALFYSENAFKTQNVEIAKDEPFENKTFLHRMFLASNCTQEFIL